MTAAATSVAPATDADLICRGCEHRASLHSPRAVGASCRGPLRRFDQVGRPVHYRCACVFTPIQVNTGPASESPTTLLENVVIPGPNGLEFPPPETPDFFHGWWPGARVATHYAPNFLGMLMGYVVDGRASVKWDRGTVAVAVDADVLSLVDAPTPRRQQCDACGHPLDVHAFAAFGLRCTGTCGTDAGPIPCRCVARFGRARLGEAQAPTPEPPPEAPPGWWKIGDRVRHLSGQTGTVRAVDGLGPGVVSVLFDGGEVWRVTAVALVALPPSVDPHRELKSAILRARQSGDVTGLTCAKGHFVQFRQGGLFGPTLECGSCQVVLDDDAIRFAEGADDAPAAPVVDRSRTDGWGSTAVRREGEGWTFPFEQGPTSGSVKVFNNGVVRLAVANCSIDIGPHTWARIVDFVTDPPPVPRLGRRVP